MRGDRSKRRRKAEILAEVEQGQGTKHDRSDDRGRSGGHGRSAEHPGQLGPRRWWDAAKRLKQDVKDDRVSLVAAGVAFFAMLSLFPAMIAAISLYGLVVQDTSTVTQQIQGMTEILPEQAAGLISEQLTRIASTSDGSLSVGLAISVIAALWSASAGMKALIEGVNIAYDQQETRGFVKLRGLAIILTLGAIVFFLLAITAIAVFPALAGQLPGGEVLQRVASIGRWPILGALALFGLAVVFRYSPDRAKPRFSWVSSGALVAMVFWLLASIGFAFYADNFSSYNETYGTIGSVIILLLWLYISAFVVLIGAELNGQLELQTHRDSTTGEELPMGERDAYAADHVAGEESRAPADRR